MKKIFTFNLLCLLLFVGCDGCDDKELSTWESLPDCAEDMVFTSLPMPENFIRNFIPLGQYLPPGHTFPTPDHYFDIKKNIGNVPIYAVCDGWIIFVTEYTSTDLPAGLNSEFAFDLAPCNKMKIKYGHVSTLEQDIINQLGSPSGGETYTTGGETFSTTTYETKIAVTAGQKIGEILDIDGTAGINFGTMDIRVVLPLINPSRYDDYGYQNTVSFVNYTTNEIKNLLYDFIQYNNDSTPLRTTPPLEGTIFYDVPGTVQGLWYLPNEPSRPEDPHLALIRHAYYPEKYVFSVGTSVPGLTPQPYEFYKESTGSFNTVGFDEITDNQIYVYSDFTGFWGDVLLFDGVILIQLVDTNTLRIEAQEKTEGPPWAFTNDSVIFNR